MTTASRLGLVLTTALASAALSGCAGKTPFSAVGSADLARTALAQGKGDKAVAAAELAVVASPRDGATRALLGGAYLEAGRFASAETALGEAMLLGEASGRTVLTRALALSALGRYPEAQALLADHRADLEPADYGLAITLAGSPQQGVEILSNALRYGENTPKMRQNLAFAFALKGDWRAARLLAAQDVTPDKLDQRLGEWAQMSSPQMAVQRVAALLGVTPKADGGQPVHLALSNFPAKVGPVQQLAAEAATQEAAAPAEAVLAQADAELPPAPVPAPVPADAPAVAAYEPAPAPVATSYTPAAPRIALPRSTPAPTPAPAAAPVRVAAQPSPAFAAAFVRQSGAYRVQLGSYASASGASEAWTRFVKRHPELKDATRVVTKANVNGRTFYRVAAGGFAKASATSFCARVRQGGGGCLAYAGTLPTGPAKAVVRTAQAKRPTRVAAR